MGGGTEEEEGQMTAATQELGPAVPLRTVLALPLLLPQPPLTALMQAPQALALCS